MRQRRVAVLVEREYQELEVWYPILRFREAGAQVRVLGTGSAPTGEYRGKYGYPIMVDGTIKPLDAKRYDAVIIPGGWAPDYLRRYAHAVEFVRSMHAHGKIVGAICHAASVLVSANILKGRTVTCFSAVKDDVVAAGARYVDREVVVDGTLVTSRKPEDLPAFCRAILRLLSGKV